VSLQSGYPFSVVTAANRSNSGVLQGQNDRVDVNTPALMAAFPCNAQNPCAYTPVPFNKNTVITGNINQWYNPAMFSIAPGSASPFGGGNTVGQLGDSGRNILRGPKTREWDFSLVKDTKAGFLGEAGAIQFRAEFFNILNHPNYGMPSGIAYVGDPGDFGPFSESHSKSAGAITTEQGLPRQIQFALKILF
jgi:hypothetical protein